MVSAHQLKSTSRSLLGMAWLPPAVAAGHEITPALFTLGNNAL